MICFCSPIYNRGLFPLELGPDLPDAKRVWLRLIKRGGTYERSYSTDGEEFITVGEREWGGDSPKWVGILAKNGSSRRASEIDAAFDFFEARSLTEAEANDPHYLERRKLQGNWEVVSCKLSGKSLTGVPLSRFKFSGSGVVITEKTQSLETKFALDLATDPKGIKLAALSSRAKTPASGVYAVEDDTLRICLALKPEAPRRTNWRPPRATAGCWSRSSGCRPSRPMRSNGTYSRDSPYRPVAQLRGRVSD